MNAMEIERIETVWTSEPIREYVDLLRAEVAKAMAMPEYMMRSADTYARAQREAWARTELMQRELVRLTLEHSWPRLILLAHAVGQCTTEPKS
jgi:hypothetical protein